MKDNFQCTESQIRVLNERKKEVTKKMRKNIIETVACGVFTFLAAFVIPFSGGTTCAAVGGGTVATMVGVADFIKQMKEYNLIKDQIKAVENKEEGKVR